ncbi:MAG: response regulator, partial [Alphaproteobacteria bacterium]|nr:response regulator [Alphaproteobacteria bacterium]
MDIINFHDTLPIGICVLARSRKRSEVLYANPAMRGILGGVEHDSLLGRTFEEIWPGVATSLFIKQLMAPVPPSSTILPFAGTEGTNRWIKLDTTQDVWEGQDCHILWATDISANKEAEERLRADVERADAVADMKSNFLATMSHEIRTPMQTIYGLLELIGEEKPDERIQSMVDIAQNAASGLLEILDDILDLAKMDADKMELDVFEVPVRMLVRGTLEALSVKIRRLNVTLGDDIGQDVPFVVIGDPTRLRQIIMNLTGNALKFTEKGSVTVRVTTKTKHLAPPPGGVGLRFEVADTGIGMSPEVCAKLFGSFTQADNTTARKFGGTGLGLSISKKLVELMGGKIGVESVQGRGSTFWFEIPTEEVGTDVTTVALPDLTGISVLSVEDHPLGAKEIVSSLRSMGAVVESCPTYIEGLSLAGRRPFDVAVIDMGLPDGTGLDLMKEIVKIRPNTGLIMYTVRDDAGLKQSLQSLGSLHLTKPASRAGLGEAVKNAAAKVQHFTIEGPRKLLIAEDTASIRDVLGRQ